MRRISNSTSAFLAFCLFASPSIAGDNHDHQPKRGGIVSSGKVFDVELVAKSDSLTLFVDDHGKPMSVTGAKAKVTLLTGTIKTEAELAPNSDGSKLEAKGSFNIAKGTKAISVVTFVGKPPITSRFEVK